MQLDTTVVLDDSGTLLCPVCEFNYLHHGAIDVFERNKGEDGDGVRHRVDGVRMATDDVAEAEIPGRRNSIQMSFYCENCSRDKDGEPIRFYVLQIMQHKGCTYFEWVGQYVKKASGK